MSMGFTSNKKDRTPEYEAAVRALSKLDYDARVRAFAEAHSDAEKEVYARSLGSAVPQKGGSWWGDLFGLKSGSGREVRLPGDDHYKTWLKDGKAVTFTSQPYELSLDELKGIVSACEKHGLNVTISGKGNWYFPGRTFVVEYTVAKTED